MEQKTGKRFCILRQLDLNREQQILTIHNRISVIGSPRVTKQTYDLKVESGRYFPNRFLLQISKNVVKVLS